MRSFLERALRGDRWAIWVAEDAGEVVATVYVQLVERVPRPNDQAPWGYVTAVYARADRRDRGIGTALLEAVVRWARSRRLEMLLVWPSERSISLYRRAGFDPSAEGLELHLRDSR